MTPRTLLITALQILALAGVSWGLAWAIGTGGQVEKVSLKGYCLTVAVKFPLTGMTCPWQGPYDNQFPGASVSVSILIADKEAS